MFCNLRHGKYSEISYSKLKTNGEIFIGYNSILFAQQKVKYNAPQVKVVKTFDLSNQKDIKWFIDTYNFEGKYESDLHLYVKQGDQAYGDMGCINNAKEDINDAATPCITITCVPQGETTKANNISLLLRDWAPFDMTESRQEKDKSFSKLGMNIANFSKIGRAHV